MPAWLFSLLIAATGVALAILSGLIFLAPRRALQTLSRFGSTPAIHFGELSLRAAIGLMFVFGADATRTALVVQAIGGFLCVSAIALMALPRRWHAAYSSWWAVRIPAWSVRVLAPISLVAGGVLTWVAS